MPVTDRDRYEFDTQGYLVLKGVLGEDELGKLNDAIDASGIWQEQDDGSRAQLGSLLLGDACFRDLMVHPRVLGHLREWLGEDLRLDHHYALFSNHATPHHELHLGATPYVPSCYYEVRGGRICSGLTVVSYALNDVPEGMGFACVPGSHKSNFACPSDIIEFRDTSMIVSPPMSAGDAIIFTEALTHGAFAWTAIYPRRALFYKYSPGHIAWAHMQWSEDQLALFTPEQRALLEPPYVYGARGYRSPVGSGR